MVSTETAVAAISACAAALALALALLAWQAMRRRSDRRFEAVLERLDEHLGGISSSLERVVERAEGVRARGVAALELAVDFDDLLRRVAVEAATRTGADGAAIQVVGPDGEPRSAEFGAVSGARSLDAPLAQATGEFRAVTINWSYRPSEAGAADPVSSALVVPIVEDGRETGTISAYAPASAAFGPEQVGVLESLAEESGPGLAAARGFAVAQRELTDTLTGLRSPKGYDVELERAVDRARETGRPLSLLILGPDDIADVDSPVTEVLRDLAGLLMRTTRATDVVCRRDEAQFGILLPDTGADPARRLYGRLLEAASRTTFGTARQLTFASGLVEWRPDESGRALDARALADRHQHHQYRSARGAARYHSRRSHVDEQTRDLAGGSARPTCASGGRHLHAEDLAEQPGDGIAVERRRADLGHHVPVGPNRSVLMRDGSWPSSTSALDAVSTNAVGPQT